MDTFWRKLTASLNAHTKPGQFTFPKSRTSVSWRFLKVSSAGEVGPAAELSFPHTIVSRDGEAKGAVVCGEIAPGGAGYPGGDGPETTARERIPLARVLAGDAARGQVVLEAGAIDEDVHRSAGLASGGERP